MNPVKPSYQSWLPGIASMHGCSVDVHGKAALYGPMKRLSYSRGEPTGYTSSPPRIR